MVGLKDPRPALGSDGHCLQPQSSTYQPSSPWSRHSSIEPRPNRICSSSPSLPPHWYFADVFMHDCPYHIETCQGCDAEHPGEQFDDCADHHSQSSGLSSMTEDLQSQCRSTTPTSVMSFRSPGSNRLQLKEEFLKLYFPAGISDHETDFMYSKFLGRESLEAKSASMTAAIDTLSLIQIGTTHGDHGLIHEAQSRYDAAVASVQADLARPNAIYDDGVLGAVYLLGFCEMYQPLSREGEPWRTHHRGLRDMLLARGPLKSYSRFAQLVVYNLRHVAAIVGHSERKQVAFSGKQWQRCSALTDGLITALSEFIIYAPGVFEAADTALKRPRRDAGECFSSLMRLAGLERDLQSWLLLWMSSFDYLPYRQLGAEHFRHFQRHCSNAPKVFPKALHFPSFSHASVQITYWLSLLEVKKTMFEINAAFPHAVLPKTTTMLVAEATEIADNLCQSVAWVAQPRFGFCGVIRAICPLHYAAMWYTKHMDIQKIAWCEKVASSIETESSVACFYHNHGPRLPCGSSPACSHAIDQGAGEYANEHDFEVIDDRLSLPP